jgi:hypothetical protein
MSTELRNVTPTLLQTRFWGGARGVCIQVTETGQSATPVNPFGTGYITLSREEALQLANELILFSQGKEVQEGCEE